jgi:hypothetical protein
VLPEQHVRERHGPVGLAQARKQVVLLQLLVIVLDEAADELCGVGQGWGGRSSLASILRLASS